MTLSTQIPLSLYIHIPWCVKKCPYCDFNSHAQKDGLPEEMYVAALLKDLEENLPAGDRKLTSIFFGGGTPSLFSAKAIEAILNGVAAKLSLDPDIEITLEANPGTLDEQRFKAYRSIGVNRLSLGVQSLADDKLKVLGRIHDSQAAIRAVKCAQDSGFDNLNIDLMYGLPQQSTAEALNDLEKGLALETPHLSWYQLTIEPNTAFYHTKPPLPADDDLWEMQVQGQALLSSKQLQQYEVSAYSRTGRQCRHNLNYWQFGDYLGIGAGAHSKISDHHQQTVTRHWQLKNPRDYLDPAKNKTAQTIQVAGEDLVFEFMLNALRLTDGVDLKIFEQRTGLDVTSIEARMTQAQNKGLLLRDKGILKASELGNRFLNDLVAGFLPEE